MKLKTQVIVLLVLALSVVKGEVKSTFWDSLYLKVKLRQSFESPDETSKPAAFTYTKPKDGPASYLIDAGVGLNLLGEPYLVPDIVAEYHRNSLIAKEQNNIQAGLALQWFTNHEFSIDEKPEHSRTWIVNLSAKYSNNQIENTESVQLTGELTALYLRPGRETCLLPNATNSLGKVLAIQYHPAVGIEGELRYKTKQDSAKGSILRAFAKIYLGLFPLPVLLRYKCELFLDFEERYDFVNTTESVVHHHPLLETGVNLILFDNGKSTVKIGASFKSGANPSQGLEDQQFFLVTLKTKM
jgi:hypothetical protein